MKNSPDLIIFDCDGVLVDSEIIGIELTLALLHQHGVEIDLSEFTRIFSGLAWEELIAKVRYEKGVILPADIGQQFYPQLMKTFSQKLVRIPDTLEVISNIPLRRCICSNSPAAQLDYMLTLVGLKPLFAPYVYSAADLGPGRAKPQPDIFLHGAQQMRAAPDNTVVIEDSVHGVIAAKRAGMYVIGFTGGSHTTPDHRARLELAGADAVIATMSDLPAEIEHYSRGHRLAPARA